MSRLALRAVIDVRVGREVSACVRPLNEVGDCNGCSSKAKKVAVIRLHSLQIRLCRECYRRMNSIL